MYGTMQSADGGVEERARVAPHQPRCARLPLPATLRCAWRGVWPLRGQGRALCEALIAADRSQEVTRASALPKAVADFYVLKAELYTGLKMINDAGR